MQPGERSQPSPPLNPLNHHTLMIRYPRALLCLLLLGSLFGTHRCVAAFVIAPPESANQAGNVDIPSNSSGSSLFPTYQQIYGASLFSSLPPGGGWIEAIYFRAAPSVFFQGEVTGISIELSTSDKSAGSLSPIFSQNPGSDNAVFLQPDQVTFVSAGRVVRDPGGIFGIGFFPRNRFFYDPSKGNLLLQMKGFNLPLNLAMGGVNHSPDMSAVRGRTPGDLEGTPTRDVLETKFVITPVPEPSSVGLGVLALCLVLGRPRAAGPQ